MITDNFLDSIKRGADELTMVGITYSHQGHPESVTFIFYDKSFLTMENIGFGHAVEETLNLNGQCWLVDNHLLGALREQRQKNRKILETAQRAISERA